ncbi:MAG: hypothetical protein RIQ60_2162 [Pseudomonadota bacterium]|jgi:hypothetical protein
MTRNAGGTAATAATAATARTAETTATASAATAIETATAVGVAGTTHLPGHGRRYVLVTPARNEAAHIAATLRSVLAQTEPPLRWVVVSDGSTDGTDEVVTRYLPSCPWLRLLRRPAREARHFAGKAQAFAAGQAALSDLDYDFIANLDADITVDPDHFAYLLDQFAADPRLGVAGTPYREGERQYDYRYTSIEHVSGACQMFTRACFAAVGGYQAMPGGGIDWVAVTSARMLGWRTRTFCARVCQHHRPMGSAQTGSELAARWRLGHKDYVLGGHPLWQAARALYQAHRPPRVLGALCLWAGYVHAWACGAETTVSDELKQFHRQEQMQRLRAQLTQLTQRRSSFAPLVPLAGALRAWCARKGRHRPSTPA